MKGPSVDSPLCPSSLTLTEIYICRTQSQFIFPSYILKWCFFKQEPHMTIKWFRSDNALMRYISPPSYVPINDNIQKISIHVRVFETCTLDKRFLMQGETCADHPNAILPRQSSAALEVVCWQHECSKFYEWLVHSGWFGGGRVALLCIDAVGIHFMVVGCGLINASKHAMKYEKRWKFEHGGQSTTWVCKYTTIHPLLLFWFCKHIEEFVYVGTSKRWCEIMPWKLYFFQTCKWKLIILKINN